MAHVAVLGSGAWGTALAIHLGRHCQATVKLWTKNTKHANEIQSKRVNQRYLKNCQLPDSVTVESDLTQVLSQTDIWVLAVPSAAIVDAMSAIIESKQSFSDKTWVVATKGLVNQPDRGTTVTDFLFKQGLSSDQVVVLSGACFANELASSQFSSMMCMGENEQTVSLVSALFEQGPLKLIPGSDIVGLQWSAVYKNIAGVASGIITGLGHGYNAQAWLIAQALKEMKTIVLDRGGMEETCNQLGGLGDLVLTAMGSLSRNRRMGQLIAKGLSLEDAQQEIGQVVEGIAAIHTVYDCLDQHLDLPLLTCVNGIITGKLPVESILPTSK